MSVEALNRQNVKTEGIEMPRSFGVPQEIKKQKTRAKAALALKAADVISRKWYDQGGP
jgi:hypothetical protein